MRSDSTALCCTDWIAPGILGPVLAATIQKGHGEPVKSVENSEKMVRYLEAKSHEKQILVMFSLKKRRET